MSQVSGATDANNVYSFKPPDRQLKKLAKGKCLRTAKTKQVTAYDREDTATAGVAVVSSFQDFLREPEATEIFGYILDGKASDERSISEGDIMHRVISFFRAPQPGRRVLDPAIAFKAVVFEDEVPLRSLTLPPVGQDIKIYLSAELGFRESLLAAHDAYSDLVILVAKDVGVALPRGDLAKQLSEAVSTGKFPALTNKHAPPLCRGVLIGGVIINGIPR